MSEFKAFDVGNHFLKPEKPFLLIMENDNEEKVVYWYQTEEELIIDKCNLEREHNLHLVDAIEIGDCRDVVFEQQPIKLDFDCIYIIGGTYYNGVKGGDE